MFRIISDLHLEGMTRYKLPKTAFEKDTVLILAGDICEFHLIDTHEGYRDFLKDCNSRFKQVIYVPGNHEYYGSSINDFEKYKKLIEKKYKKITVADNQIIDIPMVVNGSEVTFKLVCATLWTDMNNGDPLTMVNAIQYMGLDYKRIEDFNPEIWVEINKASRTFIRYGVVDALENFDPVIVVTHHGPTMKSVPPKYQNLGQMTNSLFMNTGMEPIFEEVPLKLWVHGHTHDSVDHLLGHGCRVIANPKGLTSYKFLEEQVLMSHQNKNYDELLTLSPEALYF